MHLHMVIMKMPFGYLKNQVLSVLNHEARFKHCLPCALPLQASKKTNKISILWIFGVCICYPESRKKVVQSQKRRIPWHVEINIAVPVAQTVPVVKNANVDQNANALRIKKSMANLKNIKKKKKKNKGRQ